MNAFITAYRGMDDRVKQKVRLEGSLKMVSSKSFTLPMEKLSFRGGEDLSCPLVEVGGIFWTF